MNAEAAPKPQRIVYAAVFAVSVTAAILVASAGAWQLWVFVAATDLALFLGIAPGLEQGQIHPRAVPLYNALHSFAGPALLSIASIWLGPVWLAGALGWTAHVAIDRAVGYGPRTRDGLKRVA